MHEYDIYGCVWLFATERAKHSVIFVRDFCSLPAAVVNLVTKLQILTSNGSAPRL